MFLRSQVEAVVIGGGLAGSAAAILLARAGLPVTLIEQHLAPHHKVCGEFLSAEALHYLAQLGISAEALGAAPITGVRLASGDRVACAALPFAALSLTRHCLDERLLGEAALAGVRVVRGHAVDSLTQNAHDGGWQATLGSGERITAARAMLATGKHDLRGFPRPAGKQNHLLALKQYFTLGPEQAAALERHVELHLFPGGYAGLEPVEPDPATGRPRANLCTVVDQRRFRSLGANWPALLRHIAAHCSLLRDRLCAAVPLLPKPLALSRIPYGMLLRSAHEAALPANIAAGTLWRLGDQAEVIPSFTGDGMSLALHTAFLAVMCLLEGETPETYHQRLSRTAAAQIGRATAISRLLLTPLAHPLATLAGPLLPAVLRQLARGTRIPPEARLSAPPAPPTREKIGT